MGKKKQNEEMWQKPLPLLLKHYRDKKGWTQAKLAEVIDYSDASIVRIEAGDQNWTQEFLQRAAKALDCHWFELLPLEEERSKVREMIKLVSLHEEV